MTSRYELSEDMEDATILKFGLQLCEENQKVPRVMVAIDGAVCFVGVDERYRIW